MPDDVAAILELEARRSRALVDGDVTTLDEITADDYTHVETGGGIRDKAGFLAILSRPGVRFTSWVIEENTVRIYVRHDGRRRNVAHQATTLAPT